MTYLAIVAGLRGSDRRAAALAAAHSSPNTQAGIEPASCTRLLVALLDPAIQRMDPADIEAASAVGAALTRVAIAAALLDPAWPQE